MTTFTTYIKELNYLCRCLNAANVTGAKPILADLPKQPTVRTWEAYKLIARAAAKFHYDETIVADLLDLQYKFYNFANLPEITQEVITKHLNLNITAEQAEIAETARLKKLKDANDKKKEEALNNGF